MKKRINLRLILIAGIAVIVTMVCMTGIYYKLFQGQVRKDLQINARLLSGTGLFDDPDNTNVSLSEYYEVGEDLRVTWIAKDGTVLFDNDLDISQLPNHKNRPEVKKALFQEKVSGGRIPCRWTITIMRSVWKMERLSVWQHRHAVSTVCSLRHPHL